MVQLRVKLVKNGLKVARLRRLTIEVLEETLNQGVESSKRRENEGSKDYDCPNVRR